MKILIVEDDYICRKVLKLILTGYGEVDSAEDGQLGLNAAKEELDANKPYDLICLDVMMPNMDGQETLSKIREHERENGYDIGQGSKILMITALSDHKNIMTSFKGECDGYIIKPVNKEAIAAKIQEIGLT